MNLNVERTADKAIYLKENRYAIPKEITKFLTQHVLGNGYLHNNAKVADLGCAAGEFIYWLKRNCPDAEYYGSDVVPELLKKAEEVLPDVTWENWSVLDHNKNLDGKFDLTFCLGVHQIFDDIERCFGNTIKATKSGGKAYFFGLFNDYPIDVWVKYRKQGEDASHREAGWNSHSKKSVSDFVDGIVGKGKHRYIPWEMPFDLPRQDDPMRCWTFKDESGKRLFTNGLSIICNIEILEVSV